MAEFTQNYSLRKDSQDDFYDVDVFNNNFDIIDQNMKQIEIESKNKDGGNADTLDGKHAKDFASAEDMENINKIALKNKLSTTVFTETDDTSNLYRKIIIDEVTSFEDINKIPINIKTNIGGEGTLNVTTPLNTYICINNLPNKVIYFPDILNPYNNGFNSLSTFFYGSWWVRQDGIYTIVFDSEKDGFILLNPQISKATTEYIGVTKLEDSISSTSKITAATPNSVKNAYDLAKNMTEYDVIFASDDSSYKDRMKADRIFSLNDTKDKINDILSSNEIQKILFLKGTYNIKISSFSGLSINNKQVDFETGTILNFETTRLIGNVTVLNITNSSVNMLNVNYRNPITINVSDNYGQSALTIIVSENSYINNFKIQGYLPAVSRMFYMSETEAKHLTLDNIYMCDSFSGVISELKSCKFISVKGTGFVNQTIRVNNNNKIFDCINCRFTIPSGGKSNIIRDNTSCVITNSSTYSNSVSDNF